MGKAAKKQKSEAELIVHWQEHPLDWVVAFFGDNIRKESHLKTYTGLTEQQERGLVEFGKLVSAKKKAWRNDTYEGMTEEEIEYSKKIGVSIQSGKGTGKDFFGALLLMWFMSVFYNPKCSATANTAKQLRNVYWAEVAKVMSLALPLVEDDPQSPTILEHMFEWQAERIFYKEMGGRTWFCEAVTVNAKGSEEELLNTLSGRHEKHMLFIVDEAAGVPDPVFKQLDGTLTGKINLILLIFNPTSRTGFAIDSQRDKRFVPLWWNAEESPMVPQSHIDNVAEKYGKESAPYRVEVLGLPPLFDDDTLIPYENAMAAVNREIEPHPDDPILMGVDVGAGGDRSVIYVRQGDKNIELIKKTCADTMEFVGWVTLAADRYGEELKGIMVDPIGVGHGVYTRLRELGYPAFAADVRKKVSEGMRFKKKRDELCWKMREKFENGSISILDDKDLVDQAVTIKYKPESDGTISVQTKSDRRRMGLCSPDEFDAMMLSYFYNDVMFRKRAKPRKVSLDGVFMR